jgi:hypothetical protein
MFLVVACTALTMGLEKPGRCDETDTQCASVVGSWEQVCRDLKTKLAELKSLDQSPVTRFIDRPIVDSKSGKTIAKQVSESLEAKEAFIETRRKECQYLVDLEKTLFSQAESCLQPAESSSRRLRNPKGAGRAVRERNSLLNEATIALVTVREVEGKEQFYPEEGYPPPNPVDPNMDQRSAWQNYLNMYRGFWR